MCEPEADRSPAARTDLVVAGSVGVRLPEVAGGDGPVHRPHDVRQLDVGGVAGQHIPAAHAPLRAHQPGSLEGQQYLLPGTAGGARCARRSPALTSGCSRCATPATARRGTRSRRVWTPSWSSRGDRQRGAVPACRHLHGGILDAVARPEPIPARQEPVLPAYGGGCVADIVPAILEPGRRPAASPLPAEVLDARAVVVLVLDGLGAEQLTARRSVAPTLNEMHAATITPSPRAPRPPRSPPLPPASASASTASWDTGSEPTTAISTS